MTLGVTTAVVAALAVAAAEPLVIAGLRRRGVVDVPGLRSSHTAPTPRGGGIALVLVALAVVPWFGGRDRALLLAGAGCGLLGLVEDLRGAGIPARLVAQAVLGAAGGLALATTQDTPLAWAAVVGGTIVWTVAVVNVVNFMDGINGITAAQAVVAGTAYASFGSSPLGLLVVGLAVGFAPYNVPVARVFLGDSGSYLFGGLLAFAAVDVIMRTGRPELAVAPLLLYLTDTSVTLLRRYRRGDRLVDAHRDHVYQRLVSDRGWSHAQSTALVAAIVTVDAFLGHLAARHGLAVDGAAAALAIAVNGAYTRL